MPNTTEADLFEQFKKWGHSPDTELPQTPPAPMGAVENGLWLAYRAGYLQALRDSEAAHRLAAALGTRQEAAMKTKKPAVGPKKEGAHATGAKPRPVPAKKVASAQKRAPTFGGTSDSKSGRLVYFTPPSPTPPRPKK